MRERNIAVAIILTIVTCGIYGIYWFIVLTDDARLASGDQQAPSGGIAFLLTLVTCGIYGIYWHIRWVKLLLWQNKKLVLMQKIIQCYI